MYFLSLSYKSLTVKARLLLEIYLSWLLNLFVFEPHDGLGSENEPKLFVLEHADVVEAEPALADDLVAQLPLRRRFRPLLRTATTTSA